MPSPLPRSPFPVWIWTAAAVLVLFSIFSLWQAKNVHTWLANARHQLEAEVAERNRLAVEEQLALRAARIASDPASKRITLLAKGLPRREILAYWQPTLGILLSAAQVPPPAADRTFQLWLFPKEKAAKPISAGIFRPDASARVTLLVADPPARMDSIEALAITEELAGGSPRLTSSPIWLGVLP